jgi:predicted TIM-barrel fold metal-dependent hydrolase
MAAGLLVFERPGEIGRSEGGDIGQDRVEIAHRLFPDVDRAVGELERIGGLGLRGAMIPVEPGRPNYGSSRYDKVWAAASALRLPLSMHILTRRAGAGYHRLPFLMTWMGHSHPVQLSITAMLVTGVFHRFPDLMVVSVENDIGWVPHYLYKLREAFYQFRYMIGYDYPESPIDYFHRNVWFTFQDDPVGVQNLETIGSGRVMWGSDYPHGDSTWPKSREIVARNFAGKPTELVNRVTYDNVTELYRLHA